MFGTLVAGAVLVVVAEVPGCARCDEASAAGAGDAAGGDLGCPATTFGLVGVAVAALCGGEQVGRHGSGPPRYGVRSCVLARRRLPCGAPLPWFLLVTAVYDTIIVTTFVVPIGAVIGIRGAVRQVPDKAERSPGS